jgi:hypothetical protein
VPDLTVERGSGLDLFLRMHGVQPWRIPVLLDCGDVKVFRDGVEVPLRKGPTTHVDVDDTVRISDPPSAACQKALQQIVDTDSRDYAFVPGTSPFDLAMGSLTERRSRTIRINDPSVHTLQQFVRVFENSPLIANPIRSLLVASHANDEGQLKVTLALGSPKFIDWEDLDAPLKSKALFLKHEWFLPRPQDGSGRPVPYQLLIRGCRIGTQRLFLEKLRAVLGNRIQVVAPKHFHAVVAHGGDPKGYLEYMAYDFFAKSPTQLKTKDAVVKALIQANHEFIDHRPVAEKEWKAWVPEKPEAKYEQTEYPNLKTPIDKKPARVPRKFRFKARDWLPGPEPLAMDKSKTSDADRLEVLKPLLAERPEFKSSHPFPMYVRLGYKSFDEFIAGWAWTFAPKNKAVDEVKFNATRFEYTVILPITDKTGTLVMNFYPRNPKKDQVVELLSLDDARFFETA